MIVKTKICKNKKCRDSYFPDKNKFTKWKWEFKECPTCKRTLEKYIFKPARITIKEND